MQILSVNNISKNFGFGRLFSDVSFSLNEGETILIVGPNGCRKSAPLKFIYLQIYYRYATFLNIFLFTT